MIIDTIKNYRIDHQEGDIEKAGYRVYRASWHTHRNGQPIRSKNRRPRWKFISVHGTEKLARQEISRLSEGAK